MILCLKYFFQSPAQFVIPVLKTGWSVVGCFGLNGPLRQYFSLQGVSKKRGPFLKLV